MTEKTETQPKPNDGHFLKKLGLIVLALIALICISGGFVEWHKVYMVLDKTEDTSQTIAGQASSRLGNLGNYGSFLQGTTASLWTLAGCMAALLVLLFQAIQLAEQRKQFTIQLAEQRKQFKIQTDSAVRQNFESRFFGMLDYHRQNVSEIGIEEKTGRRVFVSLIREFRIVYETLNSICAVENPQYPRLKRLDLAYLAFYYGVGPNSTRILREVADPNAGVLVEKLVTEMKLIQDFAREKEFKKPTTAEADFNRLEKIYSEIKKRISYVPFDGHQSRLGHYFRHMFQLVAYLDQEAPEKSQKEYAGIFRAQLTNHEQALLCLNALSFVGRPWIERGYLVNYALIKNIPKSFFDPDKELDLKAEFLQITFEFEKVNDPSRDTNP